MATGTITNPDKRSEWTQTYMGIKTIVVKVGRVCSLFIDGGANTTIPAFTQLTSSVIPSAYCPQSTVNFPNWDNNYVFYFSPEGVLRARQEIKNGKATQAFATYLTSNS